MGWTKAKWGMTKEEIAKAFPDATEFYNHLTGRTLGLRHFEIGSQKLSVMFVFGDEPSEGLTGVTMESEGPFFDIASSAFLTRLKDKYGAPTDTTTDDDRALDGKTHNWEWDFQVTRISLAFGDFRNPKYDFCILQYEKKGKTQDVL